jgi:hypothetical protein
MRLNGSIVFLLVLFTGPSFSQNTVVQASVEVKLMSFDVKAQETKVRLQWRTASEKNNKEFFVYRSVDNSNWFVSNVIPAHDHSGEKQYDMLDQNANGGINYYRLEAADAAGNHQVLASSAVEVEDLTKSVKITPKWEAAQIKLESAEQLFSIQLELFDQMGRRYRVDFVRDNSHGITIVTPFLDQGMYYLECFINGNRRVRKKAAFIW